MIQTEIDMSGARFQVYCTCTKIIKNQINILRSNTLPLPTLPEMVDSKRFHVDPASELLCEINVYLAKIKVFWENS